MKYIAAETSRRKATAKKPFNGSECLTTNAIIFRRLSDVGAT